MTFLLLLFSIATIEYIMSRDNSARPKRGFGRKLSTGRVEPGAETVTPGLIALGRALDKQGGGVKPQATGVTVAARAKQGNTL